MNLGSAGLTACATVARASWPAASAFEPTFPPAGSNIAQRHQFGLTHLPRLQEFGDSSLKKDSVSKKSIIHDPRHRYRRHQVLTRSL